MSAPAGSTGSYEVLEELGHGGMGDVMLARDPKMGREVALKRMRIANPPPEAIERFLREAKIQALLDHPAIVPVHDLGFDADGLPYFTMKRLAGTTLGRLLETGAATQQRLLRAVVDVCQAIELAHARRIVHRDLKPANIMLGDYGEVYVLDWGVARVLDTTDIPSLGERGIGSGSSGGELGDTLPQTKAGTLLGTPGYMAPEQVRGDDVGPPADVYALGSILFEVLAGRALHPRGAGALASTLESALETSPARRAGSSRAVAPELDAICVRALGEAAGERPTARELGDAIQEYLDGDRDLEHRRTLAGEYVDEARAALARGDRAAAVHAAGRALAMDASSEAASELLAQLLVEPPAVWPPELAAAVAAEEARGTRARSKRAVLPFLMLPVTILPFVPWLDIASWPLLLAVFGGGFVLAALSYVNWRVRAVPVGAFLVAQLFLVIMFSRLTGAFVVTPMLIAGVLLAITSVPWVNDRRWVVIGWALVAAGLPLALEALHVFDSTWSLGDAGLVTHGTIIRPHAWPDVLLYVGGHLGITLVLAMYALNFARDRRDAQRATHVHAWHLQQLLPRAPGTPNK